MFAFGDAVMHMKDGSDVLATTDFSLPYIRRHRRKRVENLKGKIIVFNYTDNRFDCIFTNDVMFLTPLSKILNNFGREL